MLHRGPDGVGYHVEGAVALGHCRLAIMDLDDTAAQPMPTPDGCGVLTYNGEIYNFRQLRSQLEDEGCEFRSSGDTEVVLNALHRWGAAKALPRFDGMFALAYVDRRTGSLVLARDRMGIKPLLVVQKGDQVVFASEAKALKSLLCGKQIRTDRIMQWIAEPRQHPHLLFSDEIEEVRPGTWWNVDDAGVRRETYHSVVEALQPARTMAHRPTAKAACVRLETLLSASVTAHLQADAQVATMCSGGVDSSLIAALARGHRGSIAGYVADLETTGEANAARRVGRHIGVDITPVAVSRHDFLRLWPLAVSSGDGPPFHPSDMALLAVAQRCRSDGIKVLLTGEGADELFAGYSWHHQTWRQWKRTEGVRALLRSRSRLASERAALSRAPFASAWGRQQSHRVLLSLGVETSLSPLRLLDCLSEIEPASERALAAHCLHDLQMHLPWLLHRHDRMGMAASIEMRVPYLQNAIVDFALHLPPFHRIRRGTGKWLLKKVASRYLPRDIVHARKKGFVVPEAYWKGSAALLDGGLLSDVLGWSASTNARVIEALEFDKLLSFHLVGAELWLRLEEGEDTAELGERLVAASERNS
jgi:asparagine synthase (glutamine-hydrolysing)